MMVETGDKSVEDGGYLVFTSVALTVRIKTGLPPVPVTVKGYVPRAVDRATVIRSVEELAEAGLGVNDAEAPLGKLLMLNVTGAVNPPARLIVTA